MPARSPPGQPRRASLCNSVWVYVHDCCDDPLRSALAHAGKPSRRCGMKLSVEQESNARRSPYPGKGLNGKEIAGEGNRNGAGLRDGRLHDRHLQHAGGLALLTGLAGLAMIGGAAHLVATVRLHIPIIAMPAAFIGQDSIDALMPASPPMSSLSKRRLLSFADIMSGRGLPSKMLSMVTSVNAKLAGASFFAA